MVHVLRLLLLCGVLLGVMTGDAARVRGDGGVSFQEIEESLTCQCGCGLTVHSCNHLQCGSALPLREEIRSEMNLGKDKDAILAHFRAKYGEKILSSPTAEGFNLLAWLTPFVLVGLGGLVVGFTLLRWRRRSPPAAIGPQPVQMAPPAARSPYEQILDRELKNFED